MSTEVLTFTPEFDIEERIRFVTVISPAGTGKEKRYSKQERGIRTLICRLKYNSESAINTIWNFFRARRGKYDSFWAKFQMEFKVTGEAVGTGDASETDFDLDYFPIDVSTFKVYLNGALQSSGYTIQNNLTTEKATIIFSSPPGAGVAITADYEYYFQVRFTEDEMSRRLMAYKLLNSGIYLTEVLWDNYSVP